MVKNKENTMTPRTTYILIMYQYGIEATISRIVLLLAYCLLLGVLLFITDKKLNIQN